MVPRSKNFTWQRSETITQCELHDSGFGECVAVIPEDSLRLVELSGALGQSGHVKAHGVGEVENLPAELQVLGFGDGPPLAEAGIDAEIAGSAKLAALSRLAGVGVAEVALGGGRVLEKSRITVLIDKLASLRSGAVQDRGRGKFPVGGKRWEGFDGSGESAGPTRQAGELPASDNSVQQSAGGCGEPAAATEGQFVHPVGIELVSGVEIGYGTKLGGRP